MFLVDHLEKCIQAFAYWFNEFSNVFFDSIESNIMSFWLLFFEFAGFVALEFFVFVQQYLLMAIQWLHQELPCFLENWLIELEEVWPSVNYFWIEKMFKIVLSKVLVKCRFGFGQMLCGYSFESCVKTIVVQIVDFVEKAVYFLLIFEDFGRILIRIIHLGLNLIDLSDQEVDLKNLSF